MLSALHTPSQPGAMSKPGKSNTALSKQMAYILRHNPPKGVQHAALAHPFQPLSPSWGHCKGVGSLGQGPLHCCAHAEMGPGGFVPLPVLLQLLGPAATEETVRQIVAVDSKVHYPPFSARSSTVWRVQGVAALWKCP